MKHPLGCLSLAAGVSLLFAFLLKPIAWVVFGGLLFVLLLRQLAALDRSIPESE